MKSFIDIIEDVSLKTQAEKKFFCGTLKSGEVPNPLFGVLNPFKMVAPDEKREGYSFLRKAGRFGKHEFDWLIDNRCEAVYTTINHDGDYGYMAYVKEECAKTMKVHFFLTEWQNGTKTVTYIDATEFTSFSSNYICTAELCYIDDVFEDVKKHNFDIKSLHNEWGWNNEN